MNAAVDLNFGLLTDIAKKFTERFPEFRIMCKACVKHYVQDSFCLLVFVKSPFGVQDLFQLASYFRLKTIHCQGFVGYHIPFL